MNCLIIDKVWGGIAEELSKCMNVKTADNLPSSKEQLIAEIGDVDVLIMRVDPKIDKEILDAAKNLKVIGVCSVGLNHIDMEYAKSKGIQVFNGRIGQRVGELGRAFKMNIVAYDPFLPDDVFKQQCATKASIDELIKVADFISIHVPLTPETKDLFNKKSIAEMKDGAVVLNMSRGGIVNEADMYEALKEGRIGGYAADVMENELAGSGLTGNDTFASPLFECDNFIVSPHIGAQSVDASKDIGVHIVAKVKEALGL